MLQRSGSKIRVEVAHVLTFLSRFDDQRERARGGIVFCWLFYARKRVWCDSCTCKSPVSVCEQIGDLLHREFLINLQIFPLGCLFTRRQQRGQSKIPPIALMARRRALKRGPIEWVLLG